MKRLIFKSGIVLVILVIIAMISCNNPGSVSINLEENEAQKEEAFSQILNNQELFNEFMNQMRQNTQTMHWMMEDGDFVHHMFADENMNYMLQHNQRFNSESMRNMMQRYTGDSTMMHSDDMMH